MEKKVLIVAASPRKNGNSDILASQFTKGAEKEGHRVEIIYLREYEINYCMGCMACLKKGKCVQNDDVDSIMPKMMEADVIVFATPVYYYDLSGQMKTFLDRCNPLYSRMSDKDFYYIVTCADDSDEMVHRVFDSFEGFAYCFENIRNKGRIYGLNANEKGEVTDTPAFEKTYELGRKV